MTEISKSKDRTPRSLDKNLRIPRTAKDAARHVRKAGNDIQERRDESPTEYAVNNVEQRGKEAARESVRQAVTVGKRITQDNRKPDEKPLNQADETPNQPKKTENSMPKQRRNDDNQYSLGRKRINSNTQSYYTVKNVHLEDNKQAESTSPTQEQAKKAYRIQEQKRRFIMENGRESFKRSHTRRSVSENGQRIARNAVRTRRGLEQARSKQQSVNYSFRSSETIKASDHMVKQAQRTVRQVKNASTRNVKTTSRLIKTGTRSIKTAKRASQTIAKTAKATQKAAATTKQMAIKTAKATVTAAKMTAKAIVLAVKLLIALSKALVAAIAAGGWIVVVVILVIAVVAAILASPIGIFYSGETGEGRSMQSIIAEIRHDLDARIDEIIAENEADVVLLDYEGDDMIRNWRDVIAVFAVKTTTDPVNSADVLILDDDKVERLKEVFWDMNELKYRLTSSEVEDEIENPDGTIETEIATIITLTISITDKHASQMSVEYGFLLHQKEMLDILLSAEFRSMMTALLGFSGGGVLHLSPEELEQIFRDLPTGTIGGDIVRFALEHLGDPYSERDCSQFVRHCYAQFGIDLPRTAADQGRYCYDNELTISPDSLVPGDLIFFSHDVNGRFLNITHVAIYAGNGMVVDSSSSRGEVVYRPLYSGGVLWGRPHI